MKNSSDQTSSIKNQKSRHILILNWRDPKNPKSGGAEKLNLHILQPLIERGDSVIWYATAVSGLPSTEKYQGITIIRYGNPLTHLIAWPFFLLRRKFGKIDLLLDCIHGTGYLSSIFAPRTNKIILICEVAQNIWDEMYQFPINVIGKLWEKVMFRFYARNKFWTISQATKQDLVQYGAAARRIQVLPMGFDGIALKRTLTKYAQPTALFVGRLAEMKGIKDALYAIAKTHTERNATPWKLHVIGRGDTAYERELTQITCELKIEKNVVFQGFVPENEKFEEMAKAWVLLVPSSREGWGMIVPEANSVGTPAIGYKVPGLSEALRRYSNQNIAISKSYESLYNTISSIKRPSTLSHRPNPGWNELYSFVLNQIDSN